MACSPLVRRSAGPPVRVGVGGETARQRAAEVARAEGGQLVGELIGQRAALHGGQGAPGVGDDAGVGGEVDPGVDRAVRPVLAQRLGDGLGADKAVAVPLGSALSQPDTMHHASAQEPVVIGVVQTHRVGPVAKVASARLGRHAAGDRQVERRDLLGNRSERAFEEAIPGRPWGCPFVLGDAHGALFLSGSTGTGSTEP